jgi:hypothetical protein
VRSEGAGSAAAAVAPGEAGSSSPTAAAAGEAGTSSPTAAAPVAGTRSSRRSGAGRAEAALAAALWRHPSAPPRRVVLLRR